MKEVDENIRRRKFLSENYDNIKDADYSVQCTFITELYSLIQSVCGSAGTSVERTLSSMDDMILMKSSDAERVCNQLICCNSFIFHGESRNMICRNLVGKFINNKNLHFLLEEFGVQYYK